MDIKTSTKNKFLTAQARESLTGNWGLVIGTVAVYLLIISAIEAIPKSGGISLLISGPFTLGWTFFSLSLAHKQKTKLSDIFLGFKNFGPAIGLFFLELIFIFLWALLLIIPGIIAAIAYSQAYFIIAENDSIGPLEAITKSKQMIKGFKWKYFCLYLRFAGWTFLCILTLGIGFLWLFPYILVSFANFYDDIKGIKMETEKAQTTE